MNERNNKCGETCCKRYHAIASLHFRSLIRFRLAYAEELGGEEEEREFHDGEVCTRRLLRFDVCRCYVV